MAPGKSPTYRTLAGNPGITPPAGACTAFNPGNSLTSQCIFGTLFAQGLVTCTKPGAGNAACITPASLTQFGINIANTGPLPPLTVLFSGRKGSQSPYSEQAEFGIGVELLLAFRFPSVEFTSTPCGCRWRWTQTFCPAPFTTATSPHHGKQVTFQNISITWMPANPFLSSRIHSSFKTIHILRRLRPVLRRHPGGKKRFSEHFTLLANYTYSHVTTPLPITTATLPPSTS